MNYQNGFVTKLLRDRFKFNKRQIRKEAVEDVNRVLFLDIDGVLQGLDDCKRFEYNIDFLGEYFAAKYNDDIYLTFDKYDLAAVYYDWDDVAIGIIKKIMKKTNATIVVHSSWIRTHDLRALKALFRIHDLDRYIVDITIPEINKEEAIAHYLYEHREVKNYVIVDDCPIVRDGFSKNFVATKDLITEENMWECINYLLYNDQKRLYI